MTDYYKNSDEHFYGELLLIDLIIHTQVIKFRAEYKTQKTNITAILKGLYISESEIDEFVKKSTINKAAIAGGVAAAGLELSQNSSKIQWQKEEIDRYCYIPKT